MATTVQSRSHRSSTHRYSHAASSYVEELRDLEDRLRGFPQLGLVERAQIQQRVLDLRRIIRSTTESPYSRDWNAPPPSSIDIQRILEVPGGVMFGSRALNIHTGYSDYDIAFSYESHGYIYEYLQVNNVHTIDISSYCESLPEGGHKALFQYNPGDTDKVDILFVHNDEDLDVIRSSVQDLRNVPAYMLENKKTRIHLYNMALQNRGWKKLRMSVVMGDSHIRGTRSARTRFFGEARSAAGGGTTPWF